MSHKPRKQLGQHFLIDKNVIDHIIACALLKTGDHVVEIGPGLGALTTQLAEQAGRLDLVEFDHDLIPRLEKQFSGNERVHIHHQDALQFDYQQLGKQLRIIGNLPYNISTPLLFHLFSMQHCITDMLFMLQKEVVKRMVAKPGSKTYGRLSVMTQFYCQTTLLFELGPEAFDPPPQVDSAIVQLIPYPQSPWLNADPNKLERIVSLAFNQRRKTLANALRDVFNKSQLQALEIDPQLRAEQLSVDDYVKLAISENVGKR